jgi:hypothetical protein
MKLLYWNEPGKLKDRRVHLYLEDGTEIPGVLSYSVEGEKPPRVTITLADVEAVRLDGPPPPRPERAEFDRVAFAQKNGVPFETQAASDAAFAWWQEGRRSVRRDDAESAVPDPMLRRLTALWRYGLMVLPPSGPDFTEWLAEVDLAIDVWAGVRPKGGA